MKKAIVIGATSGIGKALAGVLSQKGYLVGMTGRRIERLQELQSELPNKTWIKQMDISKTSEARTLLEELIREMDGTDLVIISSGVFYLEDDLNWDHEKEIIEVNVLGFAAVAAAAFNYFVRKGSGHLVGISSVSAHTGGGKSTAYNASKAFVSNYLEGLRKRGLRKKVELQVTVIEPGFVDTPMVEHLKKNRFLVATGEKAAQQILTAILRKKDHAYVTRRWRIIVWMHKCMPFGLYKRVVKYL